MNPFIKDNIETESQNWLMTAAERCAMIGLLSRLKPSNTLEIGFRFGGCTQYLAEYSTAVTSVDLDGYVATANSRWPNVVGVNSDSVAFLREAVKNGWRFDFAVIDGDHSKKGAAADLELALQCCDVIVLHDTMNPECREGYEQAIGKNHEGYTFSNLDWVLNKGIWGGLGIVVTN